MKKFILAATLFSITFASLAKNNFFANPKDPSGQLILIPNKTTGSLFPVKLQSINGQSVTQNNNAVWLKPGNYNLTFSAKVDHNYAGGFGKNIIRGNKKNRGKNNIDITIENNKVYYIAYDARDANQANWKPVVWKQK
jgi:hypothetical protein